ncbi:hypothetical protein HPB51_000076 [Rhipicephalus microplus]|uniref:Uncharacterized protein n=1 Tax=Rhipicephalus microplus TaxID=6941 RepID=A0A9J6DRG2_RHIMP|nr:hypothetical protein HPB51_000076 [Rhipicephalus microplus]
MSLSHVYGAPGSDYIVGLLPELPFACGRVPRRLHGRTPAEGSTVQPLSGCRTIEFGRLEEPALRCGSQIFVGRSPAGRAKTESQTTKKTKDFSFLILQWSQTMSVADATRAQFIAHTLRYSTTLLASKRDETTRNGQCICSLDRRWQVPSNSSACSCCRALPNDGASDPPRVVCLLSGRGVYPELENRTATAMAQTPRLRERG